MYPLLIMLYGFVYYNDIVQLKGKRGIVHNIKNSGDLVVSYRGHAYVINPAAVVKVRKLK